MYGEKDLGMKKFPSPLVELRYISQLGRKLVNFVKNFKLKGPWSELEIDSKSDQDLTICLFICSFNASIMFIPLLDAYSPFRAEKLKQNRPKRSI